MINENELGAALTVSQFPKLHCSLVFTGPSSYGPASPSALEYGPDPVTPVSFHVQWECMSVGVSAGLVIGGFVPVVRIGQMYPPTVSIPEKRARHRAWDALLTFWPAQVTPYRHLLFTICKVGSVGYSCIDSCTPNHRSTHCV
jgi:hypothetical protein